MNAMSICDICARTLHVHLLYPSHSLSLSYSFQAMKWLTIKYFKRNFQRDKFREMNENGYFYGQEELVCVFFFVISEFQLKYKLDAVVMLLSTKKAIFILLRTKSRLTFLLKWFCFSAFERMGARIRWHFKLVWLFVLLLLFIR